MAGDKPTVGTDGSGSVGGSNAPVSTGGVAPPPAQGQRPTSSTIGPYTNPNPPKAGDSGYRYDQTGAETNDQANQHLHDQQQSNPDPSGTIGASGGRYECTLGDLRQIHTQVLAMVDATRTDLKNAQLVTQATAPAQDADGSVMYANRVKQWGGQLVAEVGQHQAALREYADHLNAVIESYGHQENNTAVKFKDFRGKL